MTLRMVILWAALATVVSLAARYMIRLNDPMGYVNSKYNPHFQITYFEGTRQFDPLSYDDAMHAIREFSRLYQTSFLKETDPATVLKHMSRQRRLMHRHVHTLRRYFPNTSQLDKRVLVGLEHTDGGMAWCLSDVTQRHPHTHLMYGAGKQEDIVRAAEDVWP